VVENKPLFLRQRFLHLRLAVWLGLALALMALDGRSVAVEYLRHGIGVIVSPLYLVQQLPFALYRWSDWGLTPRAELLERLRVLERDNLILTVRSQKYAALESENMRLRELLGASLDLGDRLLVAELLPSALEPGVQKVLLNRGASDDVYVGQPFVDASGVMGQVVRVMPSRSIGLLITDAAHALPVESNRSGVRAIAVGTSLGSLLELAYVPNNADLAKGDLLVTSGLGGRFPPGYPVGRVVSVEMDPVSPFARVLAEPSANIVRSREVLLLWPDFSGVMSEAGPDEAEPATGANGGPSS